MKFIPKGLFILFSIILLAYLSLPNPEFPAPPSDALQSDEPGDTETPLRRAYFTNLTRDEVMEHYKNEFNRSPFLGIYLPTYSLNYPPEEAQTIIRDQTRSTFLEEIVHPFRESVFINGFEPKDPKDAIEIKGRPWRQKIIIRHIPSSIWLRLVLGISTLLAMAVVFKESLIFIGKARI